MNNPEIAVTGILESWYLEDLGNSFARFHGNIYNDTKQRFDNGEAIQTSKFKVDRNPKSYKSGDVVQTMFSFYQLGAPRPSTAWSYNTYEEILKDFSFQIKEVVHYQVVSPTGLVMCEGKDRDAIIKLAGNSLQKIKDIYLLKQEAQKVTNV